jgi:hypothetical protein
MGMPTLVVVSGPAGAGRTTLAHELARAVGCPAICRDEIKEGMVQANPGFRPAPGDPLTQRTFTTFFDVLDLLLRAGVTVVAEAAFQDRLWRPGLERLARLAEIRIGWPGLFAPISFPAPTLRVDTSPSSSRSAWAFRASGPSARRRAVLARATVGSTVHWTTEGYEPSLPEIVAFVNGVDRSR